MAVAALVCGVLAFIFAFIPCVGWFLALVLSVLGIIFGGVGISHANKKRGEGKGMAVAGLVLSILALGWIPLFFLLLGSAFHLSHR